MRYRELKVGMLITGKPNNGYGVTNDKSVCKVLSLQGLDNKIRVEVICSLNNEWIGYKYTVDYKKFVKYVDPFANLAIPDDKKDEVRDFQVGDYVIGNDKNKYSITKKGQICKVVNVYNKVRIAVCCVQMTPYREMATVFEVQKECFDIYRKGFVGLFAAKNIDGTIKVVDNKPVLPVQINTESPCYKQIVKELVDNGFIKEGE